VADPPGAQPGSLPARGDRKGKKRLTARAAWEFTLGWGYIKSITDSGRTVDAADWPPKLEWEDAAWKLYERINTQWRTGFNGRTGLDYGPVITLAQARGWDVDLTLELMRVIELETLKQGAAHEPE
jgi:hypothetical protein